MGSISNRYTAALIAGWLILTGTGLYALSSYEFKAGSRRETPERWPESSTLRPQPGRATLLVGIHPRCPCTKATVVELERLVARSNGLMDVVAAVYVPKAGNSDWMNTDLCKSLAGIPNVHLVRDEDGRLATQHGIETSGHAILYDNSNQRVFDGGITPSRGHSGDNPGSAAILAFLNGAPSLRSMSPVFGCAILEGASRERHDPIAADDGGADER